ncbi:MAG: TlyA family RNA methyltransferase [Pseudomonadota bacterium]|nr:TlyA family RNA methyltransferase [Pseudomonadota bacterium]
MSLANKRKRPDDLLVEQGLAADLEHAQALILSGKVFAQDRRIDKTGTPISAQTGLTVRVAKHPWVSRGGLKLDHAFRHFNLDALNAVAIDVGASTGGFTDVLLSRGAARVYTVDVGYGQLHWKLRTDNRVTVLERINARHLTSAHIPEPVDIVVCDSSFISISTVLAVPLNFVTNGGHVVALIKPQFEVAKHEVGKGGVVLDLKLHLQVCERIVRWLADVPGWHVLGVENSPVNGTDGNKEFLIAAQFVA